MQVVHVEEAGVNPECVRLSQGFTRLHSFWVPSRFVGSSGFDEEGFRAELNATISSRGMVMHDRQIATVPLNRATWSDGTFERGCDVDVPPRVEWGRPQREYFGLDDPYQMADDSDPFSWSHVYASIPVPYLRPDERIAALVHGIEDGLCLTCPCHMADVVYTTRRRVLCMLAA